MWSVAPELFGGCEFCEILADTDPVAHFNQIRFGRLHMLCFSGEGSNLGDRLNTKNRSASDNLKIKIKRSKFVEKKIALQVL